MNINGLHPVYVSTGHCVELIVEQEMPPVFAAFRMSGLAISHVNLSSKSSHEKQSDRPFLDGRSLDQTMLLVGTRLARDSDLSMCMYTLRYRLSSLFLCGITSSFTTRDYLSAFIKESASIPQGLSERKIFHHTISSSLIIVSTNSRIFHP